MHARHGPSHPLCLTATAVLLLNDHWLKEAWPGVVTGKLSDACWLIVAPVVLAAVLAGVGVADRSARTVSLALAATAYTLLQVWPPLGDAWTAWTGGRHVADLPDLLVLPFILLAPLCWRPHRRVPLALPVAAGACLATSQYSLCTDARRPWNGALWHPGRPLALVFAGEVPNGDAPGVVDAIRLAPVGEEPLDLVVVALGSTLQICPVGGLTPDTEYEWTVGTFASGSPNHAQPASFAATGTSTFRTSSETVTDAAEGVADCERIAMAWSSGRASCVSRRRDGETGDTGAPDTDSDAPDTDTGAP